MAKNLIIYYSRKGENYVNGSIRSLSKGNTEICAEFIQKAVGGDLFEVETVKEYDDYLEKITEHKEKYQNLLDYFTTNKISVRAFDLDLWDMPAAIKGKICVKGRCSHCEHMWSFTL